MTGAEYKAERERLGLTQDVWAAQICVSRRTIVRLENAARVPVIHETAMRVAAARVAELHAART
jgi:DNA-binding XRE family transcriptional regulator